MVKRGYDRRMHAELWSLQGEAVSDERQLDGSRHLAIEAGGEAQGERVLLRLVISREGALTEGELEMEGGREAARARAFRRSERGEGGAMDGGDGGR